MAANLEREKRGAPAGKSGGDAIGGASLLDMMMRDALSDLDDIPEPTAEELAALDELELDDETPLMPPPEMPSAMALLAALDEPELVSLESLDQPEAMNALDDDLDGEIEDELDDALDAEDDDELADDLLENYADIEVDEASLHDEGYDLDDDDIENYHDLYGEDGVIIPSFREGELDEDDDSDVESYDGLR